MQARKAVEDLDELQLVVEIMLEPQHDLVVLARTAEGGIAGLEFLEHLWRGAPARARDEGGAFAG